MKTLIKSFFMGDNGQKVVFDETVEARNDVVQNVYNTLTLTEQEEHDLLRTRREQVAYLVSKIV